MASKIAIRTLLIAALVVTAHTIKPFSINNVGLKALGTAKSFSFALPEAAAERIEHAYYLAQTYGKGLFDDDAASLWTKQNVFKTQLVAFANSVELDDNADIKDVKSGDPSKKPAQRRAKRIKRDENRDEESNCSKNSEVTKLPEVRATKAVKLTTPPNLLAYQHKAMTTLYLSSGRLPNLTSLKVGWILIAKPAAINPTCREADSIKVESVEAPIDFVVGPEEELFFAEPNQIALPAPTVAMPECIRLP